MVNKVHFLLVQDLEKFLLVGNVSLIEKVASSGFRAALKNMGPSFDLIDKDSRVRYLKPHLYQIAEEIVSSGNIDGQIEDAITHLTGAVNHAWKYSFLQMHFFIRRCHFWPG